MVSTRTKGVAKEEYRILYLQQTDAKPDQIYLYKSTTGNPRLRPNVFEDV